MQKDNRGMAGMSLLLVLLLAAVVGYGAYVVFQEDTEVVDTGDSSSVQKQKTSEDANLESDADIEAELAEIEDINLDAELNTADLDAELDAF